jgi:5-methylcytosine-specific restriction endonuclease McrA
VGSEAKRFCNFPQCSALISGASRYCDKHNREKGKKFYGELFKKGKKNTERADPFYSSRKWLALRAAKVRSNPICEHCNKKLTQEVHHIKPIKEYPHLKLNRDNVVCLCRSCHFKETTKEVKERKAQMSNEALWFPTVKGKQFRGAVTVVYHPPFLEVSDLLDAVTPEKDHGILISFDAIFRAVGMRPLNPVKTYAGHLRSQAIKLLTEEQYPIACVITATRMDAEKRSEYASAGARIIVVNCDKKHVEDIVLDCPSLGRQGVAIIQEWFEQYKRAACDNVVDVQSESVNVDDFIRTQSFPIFRGDLSLTGASL